MVIAVHVSVVFPAVIFEHMNEFNDELALLVLLAALVGMLVFPACPLRKVMRLILWMRMRLVSAMT